ncbi:hypothetical protein GF371_03220 [Candidatus Woesearchaeota archaeon]|nr:hypothetical protein [Candidatus Woesearchaeota archaeon]
MDSKLEKLHEWLKTNCNNYISMITVGSTATGDTLIENRSDNDVCLIFQTEFKKDIPKIRKFLREINFEDFYSFTIMKKEVFIGPYNITHDFSHKFRSKVLFGENFISEVELPNREVTLKIFSDGLDKVKERMKNRLFYGELWSDQTVQKEFWKLFKHVFMYLAIKHYYDTGIYPKTRAEVAKLLNSPALDRTLITLININHKSHEEIFRIARELIDYLD